MDLTFVSPKSQPHCTLISCAQLSATLSSAKLDFLGFSQNLRPPAAPPHLRSRRTNSRKFYTRGNYSQPFLLTASLDVNSVVLIVAVTTVSALSIAYWYHYVTHSKDRIHKTKESSVEDSDSDSDSSGFALAELGRNILNRIFGDSRRVQENHVSFEEPALVLEESRLVERQESCDSDIVDLDACIQVVSEESVATGASALPIMVAADISELALDKRSEGNELHQKSLSDLVALDDHNHVVSEESGTSGVSALPDMVAAEISELALDKRKEGNELDSESLGIMMEVKSSAVSSPVESESGEVSNFFYHSVEHEPVREGLYTFYGAKQSTMESSTKLKGFKASSRVNSDSFPSLKVNPVLKRAELSAWYLQKSEEYVAKNMPLAHYEGGSSVKTKKMEEIKGFTREKGRKYMILNNHRKLPELLQPNGTPSNGKVHPPKHLNTYNSLLRDGRLAECVDVLEDMERKGLLDMNKVYHAKFFNLCKVQSAVKEAFHFCKLIPNPTLSTFNMLMSVCAYARDSEGGFQVLKLSQKAGFNPDCKLYTTLISTCAKSGKVDSMFEVFHQMVNAGVQPNIHTYGALIDGCARAGQVAKAFGAYGIMRSKNVKPDRVIFNALITACGQSGAVDRAFDVLAEMRGEMQPIDPDHITVGALMTACANAGQVGRAREVYNMIHEYNIKGTPEVYTIAINCCSQAGDWEFASKVYDDMTRKGVIPDEMFLSSMIDVAGHAGKVDAAFEVLQKARIQGQQPGIITYSSLMGACSNAKNWQRALELYEDMKSIKLKPTVPTMNALITALCDGDQLPKATEVLTEMKDFGLCPNTITYSILFVASERKDDLDIGLMLLDQARRDNIPPNLIMYKCLLGMCLRRYQKACSLGGPVLSFESGGPQIENKWTSLALKVYRETMAAAEKPTVEVVSQVLGCLQFPCDASLKDRLIEDLGVTADSPRHSNLFSLVDGFGQYDPRAFSLFEEASSLGIIPCISFKQNPVVVDAKRLQPRIAEVYVLTVFKGLKHRLAAGAKLPNVNILLPVEEAQIMTSEGEKTINVASRVSQGITSLLRRIGLPYQGNESYGKIRINGISLRRWLQPKLSFPFSGKPGEFSSSQARLGQGITHQQRDIRTGNFALD